MKEIQLTQGYSTRVSDEDYESLSAHIWHAAKNSSGYMIYAARNIVLGTAESGLKHTTIRMHQQILSWSYEIDHIDRDGLNNQRSNLRIATRSINMQNRAKFGGGRFKGVTKRRNGWVARIMHNYQSFHLGRFPSEEEAARAYDAAATQLYGSHAYTNFLTGG